MKLKKGAVYTGRQRGSGPLRTFVVSEVNCGLYSRYWLTFHPKRGARHGTGVYVYDDNYCYSFIDFRFITEASPTRTRRFFALMRRDVNYRNQHPETSAGAGQGSTHKPDGEINMSQNTTARLFAIATFNLGDIVSKGGKQYLVAGMHGYYNSARIGQGYASDDPTSIPPTTAPSIDYTILSKDGKTSLVKKAELTLVERYESIHDKLRIGTQAAFDSARAELEEVKADFIEVVAPAPVAAPAPVVDTVGVAAGFTSDIRVTVGDVVLTGPAAKVYAAAAKLA